MEFMGKCLSERRAKTLNEPESGRIISTHLAAMTSNSLGSSHAGLTE